MRSSEALNYHNGAALLAALDAEALQRAERALAGVLAYHESQRLTAELQQAGQVAREQVATLAQALEEAEQVAGDAARGLKLAQAARVLADNTPAAVSAALATELAARRTDADARGARNTAAGRLRDAQQHAANIARVLEALATVPEPDREVLAILAGGAP